MYFEVCMYMQKKRARRRLAVEHTTMGFEASARSRAGRQAGALADRLAQMDIF